MYSYFEDDCIVLYTGLFISTAFELSKLNVLFDSMKTMKMVLDKKKQIEQNWRKLKLIWTKKNKIRTDLTKFDEN